ncbi:flagellar motor protein MotB [Frankia sp. CcI49]|uniref:tetratricopeptide repeat protein n=1 Tax=Frankia sp. CcI49 TaxID=1745382 RepID=UPI0009758F16|nr:tetratricopeptide repeat protein [Frankia sp. CcI49]ONH61698.1 flagellar motor protein MotB [Frankia sp. CcI49]
MSTRAADVPADAITTDVITTDVAPGAAAPRAVALDGAAAGLSVAEPAALLGEIMRGQAAALARSGRYADAVRLLTELAAGRDHTAAEHDLLARIHAQQGRFDDAERHWRAALALDGTAGGAVAGLHRLERLRGRRGGNRLRDGVAAGLLVVLAFGGGRWLSHEQNDSAPAADSTAAAVPAPVPIAGTTVTGGAPMGPVGELAASLTGPEADVIRAGSQVAVVFHDPLFTAGDSLGPQGRTALTGLGARLAAIPGVGVEIVGQSDGLPVRAGGPFADNAALRRARATAAALALRESGVPAAALTISAADTAVAPYADGATGDPRNRTVILRITPPA